MTPLSSEFLKRIEEQAVAQSSESRRKSEAGGLTRRLSLSRRRSEVAEGQQAPPHRHLSECGTFRAATTSATSAASAAGATSAAELSTQRLLECGSGLLLPWGSLRERSLCEGDGEVTLGPISSRNTSHVLSYTLESSNGIASILTTPTRSSRSCSLGQWEDATSPKGGSQPTPLSTLDHYGVISPTASSASTPNSSWRPMRAPWGGQGGGPALPQSPRSERFSSNSPFTMVQLADAHPHILRANSSIQRAPSSSSNSCSSLASPLPLTPASTRVNHRTHSGSSSRPPILRTFSSRKNFSTLSIGKELFGRVSSGSLGCPLSGGQTPTSTTATTSMTSTTASAATTATTTTAATTATTATTAPPTTATTTNRAALQEHKLHLRLDVPNSCNSLHSTSTTTSLSATTTSTPATTPSTCFTQTSSAASCSTGNPLTTRSNQVPSCRVAWPDSTEPSMPRAERWASDSQTADGLHSLWREDSKGCLPGQEVRSLSGMSLGRCGSSNITGPVDCSICTIISNDSASSSSDVASDLEDSETIQQRHNDGRSQQAQQQLQQQAQQAAQQRQHGRVCGTTCLGGDTKEAGRKVISSLNRRHAVGDTEHQPNNYATQSLTCISAESDFTGGPCFRQSHNMMDAAELSQVEEMEPAESELVLFDGSRNIAAASYAPSLVSGPGATAGRLVTCPISYAGGHAESETGHSDTNGVTVSFAASADGGAAPTQKTCSAAAEASAAAVSDVGAAPQEAWNIAAQGAAAAAAAAAVPQPALDSSSAPVTPSIDPNLNPLSCAVGDLFTVDEDRSCTGLVSPVATMLPRHASLSFSPTPSNPIAGTIPAKRSHSLEPLEVGRCSCLHCDWDEGGDVVTPLSSRSYLSSPAMNSPAMSSPAMSSPAKSNNSSPMTNFSGYRHSHSLLDLNSPGGSSYCPSVCSSSGKELPPVVSLDPEQVCRMHGRGGAVDRYSCPAVFSSQESVASMASALGATVRLDNRLTEVAPRTESYESVNSTPLLRQPGKAATNANLSTSGASAGIEGSPSSRPLARQAGEKQVEMRGINMLSSIRDRFRARLVGVPYVLQGAGRAEDATSPPLPPPV